MKKSAKVLLFALTVVCFLGFANSALAMPITYTIGGTASGNIGGTAFTGVLVTFTLVSDTTSVAPVPSFPPLVVNKGITTVNIAGFGTAAITDPTAIYATIVAVTPEPGFPFVPYVVLGTLDHPPATDDFTGLGGIGGAALAGYDLRTSFGPITSAGGTGYPTGLFVHTTRGNLSFTANISPATTGTFTAVTSAPEPSSLISLCISAVLLVGARVRTSRSRPVS